MRGRPAAAPPPDGHPRVGVARRGRPAITPVALDNVSTAEDAGLRYVTDDRPGITRRRSGRGFSYRTPDGKLLQDRARIEAIRALAIPPAWTDVWICPNPDGHLLATGRDARGRKQYRYHPNWREIRDATKFDRMVPFGAALPAVRERIERDLALRGLPREKVLAAVLHLIDMTLVRVGNDEYARLNASFGASTIRNEHAKVRGGKVHLSFRGKHGRDVAARVADRRLARIVRRCQELPGEELFGYLDELGAERDVRSEDVNEYVRELAGQDFTVKDFRTWGATVLAAGLLGEIGAGETETETIRRQTTAIRIVAHDLGNTPAVCRSSYIHPVVLDSFRAGTLAPTRLEAPAAIDGLRETEAYLLDLLEVPAATPS
jgi:DNA topoisomerase-1